MRFALPSDTESETIGTDNYSDQLSSDSFHSVDERIYILDSIMGNMNIDEADQSLSSATQQSFLGQDAQVNSTMSGLIDEMRTRDGIQKQEIANLRAEMAELISFIKDKAQIDPSVAHTTIPTIPTITAQANDILTQKKIVPIKWPPAYDHKNPSEWKTTYGILSYIYQRDVLERKIYQPADFFMDLYSQAVTGAAKIMITGAFQSMMDNGQMADALGLLKIMDNTFRDRNSEQNASALLHACKQFKDEALSSFLPRFQQLLSRSVITSAEDRHKLYELENALNQTTRNHLIGHVIPDTYLGFIEKLSVIGSQIEAVGLIKTRTYELGQTGTFDDGTRGIAGGKLLGSSWRNSQSGVATTITPARHNSPSTILETRDADGDIKMTGVNKVRARWVSKKELDRRRQAGVCIRCGTSGHKSPTCPQLAPLPPETALKSVNVVEKNSDSSLDDGADSEQLKD